MRIFRLKILAVSDQIVDRLYSAQVAERFREVKARFAKVEAVVGPSLGEAVPLGVFQPPRLRGSRRHPGARRRMGRSGGAIAGDDAGDLRQQAPGLEGP